MPLSIQETRFPLASERAERKLRTIRPNARVGSLLQAAKEAKTLSKRIKWLHRAASAWAEPIAGIAACARGCSHCCHIPVAVLSCEARLLAQVTGRPEIDPEDARMASVSALTGSSGDLDLERLATRNKDHLGVPCPFLVGNECSVYEHRPLVCRTHFNLDDDDLLCRLIPGETVRVPYANTVPFMAECLALLQEDHIADIRDFFPASGR